MGCVASQQTAVHADSSWDCANLPTDLISRMNAHTYIILLILCVETERNRCVSAGVWIDINTKMSLISIRCIQSRVINASYSLCIMFCLLWDLVRHLVTHNPHISSCESRCEEAVFLNTNPLF